MNHNLKHLPKQPVNYNRLEVKSSGIVENVEITVSCFSPFDNIFTLGFLDSCTTITAKHKYSSVLSEFLMCDL